MVAYSFNKRFIAPILAGTKTGTIRAVGKRRHAEAGDLLQLYTAMRTKYCALILQTPCTETVDILLAFKGRTRIETRGNETIRSASLLDRFAVSDGFTDFADMREFWREQHNVARFSGRWARWASSKVPHEMGASYTSIEQMFPRTMAALRKGLQQ